MLRRRANATTLFDRNRTYPFISRTGAQGVLQSLAEVPPDTYAVTGSLRRPHPPRRRPRRPRRLHHRPDPLAEALNLLPADRRADVQLVLPRDEGVFERATVADGIRWVAPSQLVMDCLSATGRMPSEGEAVLDWMAENEAIWRSRPLAESA